eukprot:g4634.t1
METPEQKGMIKTCLIVGGTILSFSLGAFVFRKLRRLTTPPERIREEGFTQYTVSRNEVSSLVNEPSTETVNRPTLSNWTQTFEEVVIEFPVAPDVSARDVRCTFNTKSVEVNVKSNLLMKGPLHQDIRPDECSWELEGKGPGRVLTISLIKGQFQQGHWAHLLLDSAND